MSSSNKAAYLRWKLGLCRLKIQSAGHTTLIMDHDKAMRLGFNFSWEQLDTNWLTHYPDGYTLIETPIHVEAD